VLFRSEVLLESARVTDATVVNFGHWHSPPDDQPLWDVTGGVSDVVMEAAGAVVGVALPNPVGMVRMIEWIGQIRARRPAVSLHVVVNRTPGSMSVRRALFEELGAAVGGSRIVFLPEDARVGEAAWNGTLVQRGKFRRGCDRLADRVLEEVISGE